MNYPDGWTVTQVESGEWIAVNDALGMVLEADDEDELIEAMLEGLGLLVVDYREGEEESEAKTTRLQELLDSTIAQLKRTQDERDRYMTRCAVVKAYCEKGGGHIEGLTPPQAARVLALNDVHDLFLGDPKLIRGQSYIAELGPVAFCNIRVQTYIHDGTPVLVLVPDAGGQGGAAHPDKSQDPSPSKEQP